MSVRFVADVSSNHNRDLKRALAFVDTAARVGCSAVKFQLFTVEELFAPEILEKSARHRARAAWELPEDFLAPLAARSHELGLEFACTPFSVRGVGLLERHVDFFKIASYELVRDDLLRACTATGKPVVVATGMATLDEVVRAADVLRQAGCRDIMLLHCTSGYPTPVEQCNLAAIETIRAATRARAGWSDHSVSPAVVQRAVHKWGAEMVEFHLDLDGTGAEFSAGHCWLPDHIERVIEAVGRGSTADEGGSAADGSGEKQPVEAELADRPWRADPGHGPRPTRAIRSTWTPWSIPVITVGVTPPTPKGQELYRHAKMRIPGGTQLLSKRPEIFLPNLWPPYFKKARGVEVTDLDGHTYIDMSMMGLGSCVLGYADPDVDSAVKAAIDAGSASTLNAPEEVELADVLCELHPWADMVRFARSGGEAMMMAVRIARAHTREDTVAFSGYHGWGDWYLAANLADEHALDRQLMPGLDPLGVPRGLVNTARAFHYNRLNELEAIVRDTRGRLAAIIMEPQRGERPDPGFLENVRAIATTTGAVLVFDEITTGFRTCDGGIHKMLGVEPDIAVFAKSMANGYPMAAVIGKRDVMQAAQSTFISSTNWTERIGPVAALATIRKFRERRVAEHLTMIGESTLKGWTRAAAKAGLNLRAEGLPSLAHFRFEHQDEDVLTTLFTQEMLDRGYLAFNQFKPSFAHEPSHVAAYMSAVEATFAVIADAVAAGHSRKRLKSDCARRGFYRLTK